MTQFKVEQEQQRLETLCGQLEQMEQNLAQTAAVTEKQKQKLDALKKETKRARNDSLMIQEIETMGKRNAFTGNVSLTPEECRTLKDYAINSFTERTEKMKYKEKYQKAEKTAKIWKQRYEALQEKYLGLREKAQPYLDAMEFAAETVRAFLDAVLRKRENAREHKAPALHLSTRRRPKDRIDDPYLSEKLVSEKEGIFLWCLEATNNIYASGGKRVRGFLGIRLLQRGYP